MEQIIYDVDYFINLYEPIAEYRWCTGIFYCGEQRCAIGFCDIKNPHEAPESEAANALKELINSLKITSNDNAQFVTKVFLINDGECLEYQQPTPKQRILAALYDIKKLNSEQEVQECDTTMLNQGTEAKYKNITKELAVLPIEEKSDLIFEKII